MVFSSTVFVFFFLPLCLLFYYILPGRTAKNIVLFLFSLLFYAWGEPVYILLMLLSILMNWGFGLFMDRIPSWKSEIMVTAVVLNLLLLGFFKYYGLFVDTLNSLTGLRIPSHALPLPIGISFYTFQALSYIIDLKRGKIGVQKNPMLFGLYITMFPQLIAGPIVRYEDIEKELKERTVNFAGLGRGMVFFVIGLAKKVLLANTLGALFDASGLSAGPSPVLSSWTGLIAYGLQIYFDFSGYSDMAIGLGEMLGFHFMENFRLPYISKSVTEFWRRWHISLGTWFREYVYIPLGGNRVKPLRHVLNILIVWALTGFWHGASWNFLLWGLYYGLLLLFEKYVLMKWKKMPGFLQHLWTLLTVFLGWGLFLCTTKEEILIVFRNLFGCAGAGITGPGTGYLLLSNAAVLGISVLCCLPFMRSMRDILMERRKKLLIPIGLFLFLLCTAFLVTENYNPFLYFRF